MCGLCLILLNFALLLLVLNYVELWCTLSVSRIRQTNTKSLAVK